MFRKLFPWFAPKIVLPKTRSSLRGFTIEVGRVEGCLLRSRPEDSADDVLYTDIGENWHFEVIVKYDGTNPLYPTEGEKTWRRFLTNALKESAGIGMVGKMDYRASDERYVLIEIIEEFEDHRHTEVIGGGILLPEYMVWLRVHTVNAKGQKNRFGAGLMSRPEHEGQPRHVRIRGGGTLV